MRANGAWGGRASDQLERASERHGVEIYRAGSLTMPSAPHVVADHWSCWLFGDPSDCGELQARFGLRGREELPSAFGRALIELGEKACELLRGRFVVVAHDRRRDRCVVTRDQLGAQPVVYANTSGGLLFAEHERDLLDLLDHTPSPDRLALLQWIEDGLTPAGRTLYEGVDRLMAGHRLVLTDANASVERWWTLRYAGTEENDVTALAERVRVQSFAAVGRAAAGFKRPAVKLSGGMDSACVAAGLAADETTRTRALALAGTFAAYAETDESELIEATARHTGLPLERIAFAPDRSILAPALAHIARWRLPPATPNLFLWQPLMARARELGVDLLLDGEGGDELFGGAPYLIADMLRSGRLNAAWHLTARIPGVGLRPGSRARLRILRRFGLRELAPAAMIRHREHARRAVDPGAVVSLTDAQALAELCRPSKQDRREGPLWWRYLAELLIEERDLLGVGAHFRREAADEGVERAHPFLYDLHLTEAMLRFPPQARFDPLRDRALLRDAMTGLIPEVVRTRHAKARFTSLVLKGIRADEPGLVEPLRRRDAPIRAYVVAEALDRRVGIAPGARSALSAGSLWQLAIANRWLASQADERP